MSQSEATTTLADGPGKLRTTRIAPLIARYGLVIVLAWFGAMKFTSYEAHGISHWVANSPFLSWFYNVISIDAFGRLNGSIELMTAALLAVKPWFPKASVVGGIFALAVLRDHAEFHGHDPRRRRGVCWWLSRFVRRRGILDEGHCAHRLGAVAARGRDRRNAAGRRRWPNGLPHFADEVA